eukprot:TRINITY_DN227_c0_g2_i5.p3 TRINITY_DN227_c0_g2~~TRINITY_DN227_c0_g2_i5.p3  ORF type:complete len:143 (+),score=73.93 TRINITY_DN227_c0_g2_i5:852-1280(+)
MSVFDALPKTFIKKDGSKVNIDLEGKEVGVYFSAHWCPPCRGFTPVLKKFYEEYKAMNPNFEIVFVSGDQDEGGMMSYFQNDHGDYLCCPHGSAEANNLKQLVGVQGIPTFAVFDGEGEMITKNGRAGVSHGAAHVKANGWK